MRLRLLKLDNNETERHPMSWWGRVAVVMILLLVGLGLIVRTYKASLVEPESRFHLLYIDEQGARVSLVSFDPVEQKIVILAYPGELTITSRSVGTYELKNLYTLGTYKEGGGEFARRKVQGFMRLPIVGYLVNPKGTGEVERSLTQSLRRGLPKSGIETNLSIWDRIWLVHLLANASVRTVGKEELLRAGILSYTNETGWSYNSERLVKYIGSSLFDWSVGQEGATVAIINESGIDGMGSDMASFFGSMGLDVVMVKSGSSTREKTIYTVEQPKKFGRALRLISQVFNFEPYQIGSTAEYRADIVFWIGKDALELF